MSYTAMVTKLIVVTLPLCILLYVQGKCFEKTTKYEMKIIQEKYQKPKI